MIQEVTMEDILNSNIVVPESEGSQASELAIETTLVATNQYADILHDLSKKIIAKKQLIQRELEKLEQLEEVRRRQLGQPPKQQQIKSRPELWKQRELEVANGKILNEMLSLKESGIIDGFVYGVVQKGKQTTISDASENLRSWWNEKARFDVNAPIAILRPKINPNSLFEIQNTTLGSLMSALMQQCNPPQRRFPFDKGVAPMWWPTGNEKWWGQVVTLLPEGMGVPPPYRKPHNLRKSWKVMVLIAMVKHLIADARLFVLKNVRESAHLQENMPIKDIIVWSAYIDHEINNYLRGQQIPVDGSSGS